MSSPAESGYEEKVEQLARKLVGGGAGHGEVAHDLEGARLAARRILDESESRTFDPATTDPEDDGVIRRTSTETASSGDTGSTRRTVDGD